MVNIKDFDFCEEVEGQDRLLLIFERQTELMEKYHAIEEKNGLLQTKDVPVNLHDAKGQARLKDFAWRVTEELGEALEALQKHKDIRDHFDEEVADALHFLVEFTILAGISPKEIVGDYTTSVDLLESLYYQGIRRLSRFKEDYPKVRTYPSLTFWTGRIIEGLAKTCNTLKNKPWKQSQMLTDVNQFKTCLKETWLNFIELCVVAEIDSDKLFKLYFRKSEVNKFRQRSNY